MRIPYCLILSVLFMPMVVSQEVDDDNDVGFESLSLSPDPLPVLKGKIIVTAIEQSLLSGEHVLRGVYISLDNFLIRIFQDFHYEFFLHDSQWSRVLISPDGKLCALKDDLSGIHFLRTDDGSEIFRLPFEYDPELYKLDYWSEDGKYLYYHIDLVGIFSLDIASHEVRPVVLNDGYSIDHSIAFSPNGRALVWSHHEKERHVTLCKSPVISQPLRFPDVDTVLRKRLVSITESQFTHFIDDNFVIMGGTITDSGRENHSAIFSVDLSNGKENRIATHSVDGSEYGPKLHVSSDKTLFAYIRPRFGNKLFVRDTRSGNLVFGDLPDEISSTFFAKIAWMPGTRILALAATYNTVEKSVVRVLIYDVETGRKWLLPLNIDLTTIRDIVWGGGDS